MGQRLSRGGNFCSSVHYHDLCPPPDHPPRNPPPQEYPSQPSRIDGRQHSRLDRIRRYSQIADNYTSLDQVTDALAKAGLESSNLIVGIDFTKSNEWTGRHSFNDRSLHHIGNTKNPYEQAISIIGQTLSPFDEDNLIPCFGFGDASTNDQDVFSFYPDEKTCNGVSEVLARYREIVPQLKFAGPTSFAPIIEMAMTIVEQSGGLHHILLIIADGKVTRSIDTESGQLSSQEQKTVDAIIKASEFPLSIILVGVGDEPWDMMKEFDDYITTRSFDNLQFVNFTSIMSKNIPQTRKEIEFALEALMEIPLQYKATLELGILGHRSANSPKRFPLPPPFISYGAASMRSKRKATFELEMLGHRHAKSPKWVTFPPPIRSFGAASIGSKTFGSTSFQSHSSPYSGYETTSNAPPATSGYETASTAPPSLSASWDNQDCPICLTNHKDMAFGCGHQTCCECGADLLSCPICRSQIQTRIKLY